MNENYTIEERIVADVPITKSFKGILRVSNIKEPEITSDTFLNPHYYGEYDKTTAGNLWEPAGVQETEAALSGENTRYAYGDAYTVLKLPVTDSLGNWLNFSLGAEGSLIGNYASTGIIDDFSLNPTFYTVQADTLKIGLEERKLEADKNIIGGKLYIENIDATPANLIVNSYYHHGAEDEEGFYTNSEDYGLKTVFRSSNAPKMYEGFLYNQESYTLEENEDGIVNKNCIVQLKNLRDYVFDKVSSYVKYNTTEIPPGNIIWQYCSLNKWYCSSNNTIDDLSQWQGFRPSLGKAQPGVSGNSTDSAFAYNNIEQNVYIGQPQIEHSFKNYSIETVEMPPDFKRGYVLADGSAYSMRLTPPYISDTSTYINNKISVDTFFKLFFTIGYYYTPTVKTFLNRYYTLDNAPVKSDIALKDYSYPSEDRYYFDYSDPSIGNYFSDKYEDKNITRECLYGIHLATILAFKKFALAYEDKSIFNKYIKNEEGKWDIEKSIKWLSEQTIDEEYIFNTIFSKETLAKANNDIQILLQKSAEAAASGDVLEAEKFSKEADKLKKNINNIIFNYKSNNYKERIDTPDGPISVPVDEELPIIVGREVSKFSDYIEYYTYEIDGHTPHLVKTYCPIYKMAEIYDIARKFAIKDASWDNYIFTFNVPKTYSKDDINVNEQISLSGNIKDNTVGLFIGSNAMLMSDEVYIPSKDISHPNGTVYNKIDENYTYQQSNCTFTLGFQPHSHAIAKGSLQLQEARYKVNENAPIQPLSAINIKNASRIIADVEELKNNIIAADFTWEARAIISKVVEWSDKKFPPPPQSQTISQDKAIINYFLMERGSAQNVKLRQVYNGFNGLIGKELTVYTKDGDIDPDMQWYGRTSPPIWDPTPIQGENSASDKYTKNDILGYYRPQSVMALPLIKL
jgi:hypothetical protein